MRGATPSPPATRPVEFGLISRRLRGASRFNRLVPLYDFRCRACQATFEEHVPAATLPPCPACGAPDPERVLTGFAGPLKIGLRGREAKRSNERRRAREERRQEGFARQREERRQRGE